MSYQNPGISEISTEKSGETMGMNQENMKPMEVVDMSNNEHFMLMIGTNATFLIIEPELRRLAHVTPKNSLFLMFQSRLVLNNELIHPLITDENNTFYLLCKPQYNALSPTERHSPVEEAMDQLLGYETRLSKLLKEVTQLKVESKKQQYRINELELLLRSNRIPLPEEQEYIKEHETEIQETLKEATENQVVSQASHLKWTEHGIEGTHSLLTELEKTHPNLEVLDVSDMQMGDEGCKMLAKFFSQGWSLVNVFQFYFSPPTMPRLHTIILYGNDIGKEGASALISAFRYLPQVELLGLEVLQRRLSAKEENVLHQMQLESVLFTSTSLNLTGLSLGDNFLVQLCGYIDYLITGENSSIRRIYMNKNHVKSRGTMKLASLIADGKIPHLEILNLENNDIDHEAAQFLANSFGVKTTPHMNELYLGGNAIGDKGVQSLFRSFRKNSPNSITHMSLNKTGLGYEGIKFISNCALFNCMTHLVWLDISSNNLESKGFVILIKSMERGGFPSLESLNVSDCKIGDDGCRYLMAVMSRSQLGILREIHMMDNHICHSVKEACKQALSNPDRLRVVFAESNY